MTNFTSPTLRRLLLGSAASALLLSLATTAQAQTADPVSIDDARTTGVATSTAGDSGVAADVTVEGTGSFALTDTGPALTLDSDNALNFQGAITVEDVDNAVGINIITGNTGSFVSTGQINLVETVDPEDTDEDGTLDGAFATGTGRTGILISGADTFTGPVDVGGSVTIEGNNSAGLRLLATSGVTGNISLSSNLRVLGTSARGVDLAGATTGNVSIGGSVATTGEGASAVSVSGDVSDRLSFTGTVTNTGYRNIAARQATSTQNSGVPTRQAPGVRDLFDADDLLESNSAINVSANVGGGIHFAQVTVLDDEGTLLSVTVPTVIQTGAAAAVLIAGDGTPIIVGRVADITDMSNENYNADLQYSFVNQGSIAANGVLDDVAATGVRIENATLSNGFNNTGQISALSYRSANTGDDTNVSGNAAQSSALILGSSADINVIQNSGQLGANAVEAADVAFADEDNPLAANPLSATTLSIEAGANTPELNNTGSISATLVGRTGQAYALVDASGTLAVINNQGVIQANGITTVPNANTSLEGTTFTLIAVDVTANSSGVTLTQSQLPDTDTTDEITPSLPAISGDVLLGSGADTVDIQAGLLTGDVSFGDGADVLMISGGSTVTGALTDSDGLLTIDVVGSTLTLTEAVALNATSASFDSTSTFTPFIDGSTGTASTLTATGTVSFADGASLTPTLANVIGSGGVFTLIDAGTLSIGGDIADLQPTNSPFLYDTSVALDPNNANALIATLTLRNAAQLGLDTAQAAAFDATFNAISADATLGSAFAQISDGGEFNAAYNQLLPEFAAAVHRFVHSNIDGATGAVGTHLDNARLSDEKPGGAWIEEFAYFADRDLAGLSEAYRGNGFGFTGGFDTEFGPFHTAGVNLGFAATEIEDVLGQDDPLAVTTLQAGLYAGYETGRFGVDLYVGGGVSDIESKRNVSIGTYSGEASADWSASHYNASATAGYDLAVGERFFVRPSVNVSYLSLTEDSYNETGASAIALSVDERTSELGTATALLNFGGRFEGDRLWYSPMVRLGFTNDFTGAGTVTDAMFLSTGERLSLASQEFPDTGVILGVSFAAGSKYSSFGFDYDADLRDGYNRHIARLVMRLLF